MSTQNSPTQPLHRDRGGRHGNQNARSLTSEEQELPFQASEIKGIHAEIALLRVKVLGVLPSQPASPELLLQAARTLTRMVAIPHRMSCWR